MGSLTNPNKHLYTTHRAASATYQEQHNVLPVASSQLRFNLLPMSTVQGTSLATVQPAIPRIDPEVGGHANHIFGNIRSDQGHRDHYLTKDTFSSL